MNPNAESPQVKFPPPFALLIAIVLGLVLQYLYPMHFSHNAQITGAVLIIIGLALVIYCVQQFKKFQTAIQPWKPSSHLICVGIYRYSRNPIYLGFLMHSLGVALLANSAWNLFTTIALFFWLKHKVIAKEEFYLEQKFGQEYLEYKKQVRRW